ncbi:MAG: hypothetical protein H0T66_13095 [Geodermatophilaceae bacterium]|nr:hypothetical protein [Geodermatophilaceae bacterium]
MSNPATHTRALFARLIDDAAMFPPGNATAADAIAQHLNHRSAAYSDVVGPLLVHVDRWGDFASAHRRADSPELAVVIIGSATAEPADAAGIDVVGHEVAAPLSSVEAGSGGPVAVELSPQADLERELEELARMRERGLPLIAKYRTGGTAPEAFPSADQMADVIWLAVRHGVPIKFTAGLHFAVRHADPGAGFFQHGFLNLAVAVHAAQRGLEPAQVSRVLSEMSPGPLVSRVASWSPADIAKIRSTFTSFGCCGVTEAVADAAALGLLPQGIV